MYTAIPKKILQQCILFALTFLSAGKILSQPVADFSATPVSGCAPLLVNFTDLSTGNPTSWKWDLGDGTISFLQNPSVTYFSSGQYKITLIATNSAGSNTIVKDQYITVQPAPVGSFMGSPTTGCAPLSVQFSDKSVPGSGILSSWKWDFGDGITSLLQNPQHTYTLSGTNDVTLQVKNSFGCTGTISKTKYIKVENVIADFSNNIQSSCKPPVTLNFQNLSTGSGALTYKWDFGDGTNSTATNPSHTYVAAGSYTVQLIASSAGGCSNTMQKVIVIGTVSADFTSPASVCPQVAFALSNKSLPVPGSTRWSFGDGTTSDSLNPVKVYNTPGKYTIKMVADFGACRDSISKSITVLPKQSIAFSAVDTTACKPPLTVKFTSNIPGATGYIWDFGDGTTSSFANPSHTYTTLGDFDVTLIGISSSGCQDTLLKPKYVKIESPAVTLPDLPLGDCIPFTHIFSANLNSFDSAASYLWDFGDGTTATTPTPSHTFTAIGSYTISVTITTINGCSATTSVLNGVKVGTKPKANFKASPLIACASVPINFTDLSTGNVNEWLWKFGDGTTSAAKNPVHLYKDTGFFTVTLIARSTGCPDMIAFSKYIYIKPPVAKFSVKNDCTKPKQKIFLDSSKGADTWQWDFGDGTTSITRSPVHIYADTGTYTVSLTVTNFSTGCAYTSTQQVYVIIEKADFTANLTNICKEDSVIFLQQNINTSKISNFNWNFGDGVGVNSRPGTVTHKFTKSGIFPIRLTIVDLLGCKNTLVKPMYIKVEGPTALFTSNVPGTCLNSPINFIDNSLNDGTHPITQWIWSYGDNTREILNGPPFKHSYNQPGTYTVTLKVIDNNGCTDSLIKPMYIVISKPSANFTTKDTASCPFKPINFTSLSTGPNLTYSWNFGDGSTSVNANPVYKYADTGTFTVSLKITDQYGCTDSIKKINYITTTYPKANFSLSDSVSACPPFFVTFNNLSTQYDSLLWDFGDGNFSTVVNPTHFYYIPGTYIVKLRAIGPGGCYDDKFGNIIVNGPKGVLSYTNTIGCNTLRTDFKATAKDNILFIWDFNDGTTVKTSSSSISHTYLTPGFYLPKLILEDVNGCQVPILGIDTIKVFEVKANFNSISKIICEAGVVSFKDSSFSNDVIENYLWNFGDGSTSSLQSPDHNYTSPGLYTVSLNVTTTNGCKNKVTKIAYVKITAAPKISISGNSAGCKMSALTFKGIFLQPDTSAVTWQWNFANGQTSLLQNPLPQIYSTAQNYIVNAIATNSSGCMDTASFPVTINPLPDINAGEDVFLCLGKSVQLQATGAVSYQWLAPANFLSCTNCSNPLSNTPDNKMYFIEGTNIFGCTSVDSVLVKVKKPFKISINPQADSLCIGQKKQLNATYAENYLWTPAADLSNAAIKNPQAFPQTTTTYKVLGYDSANCFKDSAFANITVFKIPEVEAGVNQTISSGSSVLITPKYSDDVVNWLWAPASGLNCANCPAPLAMPNVTTTYSIKIKNSGGCEAVDNVTIFVICNNENIFIPNTFSPNGDGVNDVFYPRGKGLNRIRGMKIFNRWGQVVFERSNFFANDLAAGWDGMVAGKQVTPDVYTFVIDVICDNTNVLTQAGTITLIK